MVLRKPNGTWRPNVTSNVPGHRTMKKTFRLTITCVALIILSSCFPSGKEVAGKYYAKHGQGIEYLDMREDHTFTQYFKNDKIEKAVEGKWEFENDKPTGQLKLILRSRTNFVDPYAFDDSTNIGTPAISSVYWDKNTITVYPDLPEYNYHRKE